MDGCEEESVPLVVSVLGRPIQGRYAKGGWDNQRFPRLLQGSFRPSSPVLVGLRVFALGGDWESQFSMFESGGLNGTIVGRFEVADQTILAQFGPAAKAV